jgi:hypothetical protein
MEPSLLQRVLVFIESSVSIFPHHLTFNSLFAGTGEQMAHTMIASKAVERMFETEDELVGLHTAIEADFMGKFFAVDVAPGSKFTFQGRTLFSNRICRLLWELWPSSSIRGA